MGPAPRIRVSALPIQRPKSATLPPAHHIGTPPHGFRNPWPSFRSRNPSLREIFKVRFGSDRTFVPVPTTREELVPVRQPNFSTKETQGLKLIWIGHASFYVETTASVASARGIRLLFDPVWSRQVGPYGVTGPVRFTETPFTIDGLPEIDVIVISHNHYDHLDVDTIRKLCERNRGIQIFCPLKLKPWFLKLGAGLKDEEVTELDWWDGVHVSVHGIGKMRLICTPSQHTSRRTMFDGNRSLWCSWILEESSSIGEDGSDTMTENKKILHKKLFFAGDTAYREVESDDIAHVASQPRCPIFEEIGDMYGPFDVALLPIGCFKPRKYLSSVHCAPEDAVEIHKDIRSKKSFGMHYGTIRGGLSSQYEDVREPPKRFKDAAEKAGLRWGEEIGVCDIGEVVVISSGNDTTNI